MNFRRTRLSDYSVDSIKSELLRVAALVGGPLTSERFTKFSKVSTTTLLRRFGSWEAALQSVGLDEHYIGPTVTEAMKLQSGKGTTPDQALAELKRVAELLKQDTLTIGEFRQLGNYDPDIIRRRFGSWSKALSAAGLATVAHAKRYSERDCLENIATVWEHLGREPKYKEMNSLPSLVGGKAYLVRWGRWSLALDAFVDWIGQPSEEPEPIIEIQSKKAGVDTGAVGAKLRWLVLRRDGFACQDCGHRPPEVKLHVDHRVPYSKGGKTDESNLRALCSACNLGKSNLPFSAGQD